MSSTKVLLEVQKYYYIQQSFSLFDLRSSIIILFMVHKQNRVKPINQEQLVAEREAICFDGLLIQSSKFETFETRHYNSV
mmetsp:Transcript_16657/g.45762  ORF Transcript_16657/g.45762 Transcript_16657/m.45762 type:complete len:80 (-) Transcript_16657:1583-1822(-)